MGVKVIKAHAVPALVMATAVKKRGTMLFEVLESGAHMAMVSAC
jgi:hypothetical protein